MPEDQDEYQASFECERCGNSNDYCECDPTEPEEGDYVTEDHRTFWVFSQSSRRKKVVVEDDLDWRDCLKREMDIEKFWPDVWFLSDHGNYHLMSLEKP